MKNYNKLKKKIKTGDIYFTSQKGVLSNIVKFFTRSTISHCGILIWIGKRLFVVDVNIKIRLLLASEYFKNKEIYIGRIHSPRNNEYFIRSCLKDLGKKYDIIGAISSLFIVYKNKKYFCSEFVSEKLMIKLPKLNRGILPIDLYNISKKVK